MAEPTRGARSRRRNAALLSAAAFLAAAGLGHALIRQDDQLHAAVQREAASQAAAGAAFALERQLSRSLSAAYALAAVVRQHGGIERFDALAEEMLGLYGGISSLQLAPGGIARGRTGGRYVSRGVAWACRRATSGRRDPRRPLAPGRARSGPG